MKGLLIFIGGTIVGAVTSFIASNYILEKKYNELYEKEMDELREHVKKERNEDSYSEDAEESEENFIDEEVKKEMVEKLKELGYGKPFEPEDDDEEEEDTWTVSDKPILINKDEADIYIEEEKYDVYNFDYSLSRAMCYCGSMPIDICESFGSFELFHEMKLGGTYYILEERDENITIITVVE